MNMKRWRKRGGRNERKRVARRSLGDRNEEEEEIEEQEEEEEKKRGSRKEE